MEFSVINGVGLGIVIVMLIPNIFYALHFAGGGNRCASRWMSTLEQIGRYGCMLLMVFPVGVWKFGFSSTAGLLLYCFGNGGALLAYLAVWLCYFKRPTRGWAMALALLPTFIFLLSGLTLRHWLLVLAAVLFGIGHSYVTCVNSRG